MTERPIPDEAKKLPTPPERPQPDVEIVLTPNGLAHRVHFFDAAADATLSAEMMAGLVEKRMPYMVNGEQSPVRKEDNEEALERSAVLALRIEADKEKVNDNLGSLVKVGMKAFQALVYGQRVVISIEQGFEESLSESDPGALAQFEALRVKLDMLHHRHPGLIQVLYDSTEEQFLAGIETALKSQDLPITANRPLNERDMTVFEKERQRRLAKKRRYVTMGGSSSPFSKQVSRQFGLDQKLISQVWADNGQVTALNQGFFKEMWEEAYAPNIDSDLRLERMREAFLSEQGHKDNADVLVWLVQSESVSKAAITEIGFLLMNAFDNGQELVLLLEPFDSDDYIRHLIGKDLPKLQTAFPNDPVLKQFSADPTSITYEMVMDSPLAATSQFKEAEAALKVRRSVEQELEDLQNTVAEVSGRHSVELFSLSKDVSDCIQKSRLLGSPESVEGRGDFYRNFDNFKKNLAKLIEKNPGQRDKVVELVNEAMAQTVELGEAANPLKSHLVEATQTSKMLEPFMNGESAGFERGYLTREEMSLITNVITPLHDVLKFLSKPDAQALPDHEILMAYIANEFFPALGYQPHEIEFISTIIGNHENIFKEKGREKFASSNRAAERGMSVFFIIDSLTGALENKDGKLSLDPAKLESRFTDLYVRHMDPVTRKISLPRPEWGLYTVKDYIATCRVLEDNYGVKFSEEFLTQIVDAALDGIKKTFLANGQRASDPINTLPTLTDKEIMKILAVKDELTQIKEKLK